MNFDINSETEILHASGGWSSVHDTCLAGGPQRLQCDGTCLMRNYSRSQDDMTEDMLMVDKVRIFRKGGAAVYQSRGHFPYGAENVYLETIRYAGNTARVTNDIRWHAGSGLKNSLQLGSAELPGKWLRLKILTLADDGNIHVTEKKLDLAGPLRICPQPMAVILENEDGSFFETGLGGDLWRWQAGLNGLGEPGSLTLESMEDGIRIIRTVVEHQGEEELQPEAREYRFCAYFAWSCPSLRPPEVTEDETFVHIRLDAKKGADSSQLRSAGENPKFVLDLSGLPLPKQAIRSIDGMPCWESKITQKYFRRLIRQLSELKHPGTLVLAGGMYPGLCCDGVHCCRKQDAWHWDIIGILDACSWMRQCLGDEWVIAVRQPSSWQQLPSLSCLGAANGFRVSLDDEVGEDDIE